MFVGKKSSSKGSRTQKELLSLLAPHAPRTPFEGPLSLTVHWVYPWRKSEPKRNRERGFRPCDTRSDCDNLAKLLEDCMTRLGFWGDDSQVAGLHFNKWWGDTPQISVTIKELNKEESA